LPPESHYEDYPQIGNGVGSIRQFLKQFQSAARRLPKQLAHPRRLTWVVGNAVEQAFQPILDRFNQVQGLEVSMVAIASQYWGQTMTVTGLLTGQDILHALKGRALGDAILLPSLMLKHNDTCFLDDMTVADLSHQLQTPILIVGDVEHLIETVMDEG
jgi:putative radical SAM enzyme (TIGR03279 family)